MSKDFTDVSTLEMVMSLRAHIAYQEGVLDLIKASSPSPSKESLTPALNALYEARDIVKALLDIVEEESTDVPPHVTALDYNTVPKEDYDKLKADYVKLQEAAKSVCHLHDYSLLTKGMNDSIAINKLKLVSQYTPLQSTQVNRCDSRYESLVDAVNTFVSNTGMEKWVDKSERIVATHSDAYRSHLGTTPCREFYNSVKHILD